MEDEILTILRQGNMKSFRPCIFDPSNSSPWYDQSLFLALKANGLNVALFTSPFQYRSKKDLKFQKNYFYPIASFLHIHGISRRMVCGVEHIPGWLRVVSELRKLKGSIVFHSQWMPLPLVDIIFLRYLKTMNIPLVHTVHNLLPHKARPYDRRNYSTIYNLADHLIAHTEKTAQGLIDDFGIGKDKISIIPLGISGEDYPIISRDEALTKLGLSDQPTILFFGALRRNKGLRNLLKALSLLLLKIPNARLIIAGKPEEISNEEVDSWIEQYKILPDRVIKRLEFISDEEVPYYFSLANCAVYPYENIDQSAALTLGMTLGRPVIVTSVGGMKEIVSDHKTGLVVPVNDIDALADAMIELLRNSEKAEEMGVLASEYVRNNFGWNEIAKKTIKVYHQVLSIPED